MKYMSIGLYKLLIAFMLIQTMGICFISNVFSQDEIKWYLPSDLWSNYPINNLKDYDKISSENGINFYSNSEFKGAPIGHLKWSSYTDKTTGEECHFESHKFKTKLTNWITCLPYKCDEKSVNTPQEVIINEPLKPLWMGPYHTFQMCKTQLNFVVMTEGYSKDKSYSMILPAGQRDVNFGNQKIYPDLRPCNKKGFFTCSFNESSEENSFSLAYRKEYSKEFKPLSYYIKSKECLESIESKGCLKKLTLTAEEKNKFEENFGGIKNLEWTSENILELKACMKDGSQIDETHYKGIKKKCLRWIGNNSEKIAVIDYPEAFDSHGNENPQFEFNNYLKP